MSTRNIKTLRYLALFVAILSFGAIASGDASAASTFDTYTDGDGVVWDRETTDDGDIYIGVQSVPSGVTTITVPSMSAVASGKSTYFLDSICYYNGGCSSVVADTANVTKLDMTNTSGIQIKNVSHVFDTNHEVELIFGENVVIADPRGTNASGLVDNDYYPIGSGQSQNPYTGVDGAFEGMKIKLTGFDNVKYIGWNAFRNTELNQSNVDITIGDSQTIGAYVFAGSNVKSLSINLTEVSQGFCQNCASLESLTLGSNVQIIRASAFENTTALAQRLETSATRIYAQAFKGSAITGASLTSATAIDRESFMNTNLSTGVSFNTAGYSIGYMAFRNAGLSEVDLSAVLTIEAYGFADNSIT
ncbi:leucine-rich repeat protein, partial [Candidatus Saccharibacteria bacterium]|nr:leucine-rich repeat protein [Candidatus Saccharibacteria bacterium]